MTVYVHVDNETPIGVEASTPSVPWRITLDGHKAGATVFFRDRADLVRLHEAIGAALSRPCDGCGKPGHSLDECERPYLQCDRCNYDQHRCPGCGDDLPHRGPGVHPECAAELDTPAEKR